MNWVFTNKISQVWKALSMQPKAEEFAAELEASETQESQPKSFGLYQEYSQRDIAETIRTRKDAYEKADLGAKGELETEVDIEVENFHIWLESVRRLEPIVAHYYSVSLKSLLLGLPIGVQVARLFDVILVKLESSPSV
jgi:hypothetical protein